VLNNYIIFEGEVMSDKNKLRLKLIITIILFLLAILMLVLGVWAAQAGNGRFKGYVNITTEDVSARITAQVTGSRTATGDGYDSEKVLWDTSISGADSKPLDWKDIDFTFADKNSVIELTIKVENRKIANKIDALLSVKLGDDIVTETEQEIGETNVVAYLIAPTSIGNAIDENNYTSEEFKVYLKIADKNKSVKAERLEVLLTLTNANL